MRYLLLGLVVSSVVVGCGGDDAAPRRNGVLGPSGGGTTPPPPVVEPPPGAPTGGPGTGGPVVGPVVNMPPNCGNGQLTSDEACDDGNKTPGDGCNETCTEVQPGFICRMPGQPCRQIARCGDGVRAFTEQCDDGNLTDGDGCNQRCRYELGWKCDDSTPSVCSAAECGNGEREGAESCDDGNTAPFDGCSSLCLREPNCEGESCTSDCGDGLLINEDCDDGNNVDGDGCSATCETEGGFMCEEVPTCEMLNGECVLRVPAIFRDFSDKDPDFGWPEGGTCGIPEGLPIQTGIAQDRLDMDGRPVLGKAPAEACIQSAQSFATWFRDGGSAVKVVGDVLLFDNGSGGYVNRFGENGEKLTVTVKPPMGMGNEQQVPMATSQATCEPGCAQRVRSGLQCDNVCRPDHDAVRSAGDTLRQRQDQLAQAQAQLEMRLEQDPPDEAAIAMLEEQVADLEATVAAQEEVIAELTAEAEACDTDCTTRFDTQVQACVADCKPCSFDADQWCTGGLIEEFDGTPLFFPVDSVMGPTRDPGNARLPLQYGYTGWPEEGTYFPNARQHNFYFTSEVQYWFRYEAGTNARLDFTGDDDVWVFVNGRLAVDLGGIHVPMDGSVTINAQSAARFGLEEGNVYKIVVFQAERKMYGSSFRLTLSGFEATPSECTPECGDGVLTAGEECDDGRDKNLGGYNGCAMDCTLGPFCGNGIMEGEEACDNGPGGGPGCPGCRKLKPPE